MHTASQCERDKVNYKTVIFERNAVLHFVPARVRRTLQLCGGQNNQRRVRETLKSALLTSVGGFAVSDYLKLESLGHHPFHMTI